MLNCERLRRQRGVTIAEMLITVSLVAVLAAIAVPNFSAWQGNSRIRASADTIHTGMRLARAEAVTRNAQVRFALQPDGSWTVGCVTVTANCPALLHTRPGAEVRGGVTLAMRLRDASTSSSATTVVFNSRGVPDANTASLRRVDVSVAALATATRDLRITLSDLGQTRLCDPRAASGTPTTC